MRIRKWFLIIGLAIGLLVVSLSFIWYFQKPLVSKLLNNTPKTYSVVRFDSKTSQKVAPQDVLVGKGIPDSTVKIFLSPGKSEKDLKTNGGGSWSYTLPPTLKESTYRLTTMILDKADQIISLKSYKLAVGPRSLLGKFSFGKLLNPKLAKAQESKKPQMPQGDWVIEMESLGIVPVIENGEVVLYSQEEFDKAYNIDCSKGCVGVQQPIQNIVSYARSQNDVLGDLLDKLANNGYVPLPALEPYFPEIVDLVKSGRVIAPNYVRPNPKMEIDEATLDQYINEAVQEQGWRKYYWSHPDELTWHLIKETNPIFGLHSMIKVANLATGRSGEVANGEDMVNALLGMTVIFGMGEKLAVKTGGAVLDLSRMMRDAGEIRQSLKAGEAINLSVVESRAESGWIKKAIPFKSIYKGSIPDILADVEKGITPGRIEQRLKEISDNGVVVNVIEAPNASAGIKDGKIHLTLVPDSDDGEKFHELVHIQQLLEQIKAGVPVDVLEFQKTYSGNAPYVVRAYMEIVASEIELKFLKLMKVDSRSERVEIVHMLRDMYMDDLRFAGLPAPNVVNDAISFNELRDFNKKAASYYLGPDYLNPEYIKETMKDSLKFQVTYPNASEVITSQNTPESKAGFIREYPIKTIYKGDIPDIISVTDADLTPEKVDKLLNEVVSNGVVMTNTGTFNTVGFKNGKLVINLNNKSLADPAAKIHELAHVQQRLEELAVGISYEGQNLPTAVREYGEIAAVALEKRFFIANNVAGRYNRDIQTAEYFLDYHLENITKAGYVVPDIIKQTIQNLSTDTLKDINRRIVSYGSVAAIGPLFGGYDQNNGSLRITVLSATGTFSSNAVLQISSIVSQNGIGIDPADFLQTWVLVAGSSIETPTSIHQVQPLVGGENCQDQCQVTLPADLKQGSYRLVAYLTKKGNDQILASDAYSFTIGEANIVSPSVSSVTINNETVDANDLSKIVALQLPGTEGQTQDFSIPLVVNYSDGSTRYSALTFNYQPLQSPQPVSQTCTPGAYDKKCSGNCGGCNADAGEQLYRQCNADGSSWGDWQSQCSIDCVGPCSSGSTATPTSPPAQCTEVRQYNECTGCNTSRRVSQDSCGNYKTIVDSQADSGCASWCPASTPTPAPQAPGQCDDQYYFDSNVDSCIHKFSGDPYPNCNYAFDHVERSLCP